LPAFLLLSFSYSPFENKYFCKIRTTQQPEGEFRVFGCPKKGFQTQQIDPESRVAVIAVTIIPYKIHFVKGFLKFFVKLFAVCFSNFDL